MLRTFAENRKRRNTREIEAILAKSTRLSSREFHRLEQLDENVRFWNRFA